MYDSERIYPYLHDSVGNTNKHHIVIYRMQHKVGELGHLALSQIPVGILTLGNIKEMHRWIKEDVEQGNPNYLLEKIDSTLEAIQKNHLKSISDELRKEGYLVVKQSKLDKAIEKLNSL